MENCLLSNWHVKLYLVSDKEVQWKWLHKIPKNTVRFWCGFSSGNDKLNKPTILKSYVFWICLFLSFSLMTIIIIHEIYIYIMCIYKLQHCSWHFGAEKQAFFYLYLLIFNLSMFFSICFSFSRFFDLSDHC